MGAAEFIDQLFSCLRINITSRCHGFDNLLTSSDITSSASAAKRARDLSGRWLAHDIADVVVWCSSADAPEKILAFVESFLAALAVPMLTFLESDSKASTSGSKKGGKGWISKYASSMAIIAVCSRLLSPLLSDIDLKSVAVSSVVKLLSQACVSVLALCGGILDEGGRLTPSARQLIGPAYDALSIRQHTASSSSSSSGRESSASPTDTSGAAVSVVSGPLSAEQSYFVLQSFLVSAVTACRGISEEHSGNIRLTLYNISFTFSSEKAKTMRLVCNDNIDAAMCGMFSDTN